MLVVVVGPLRSYDSKKKKKVAQKLTQVGCFAAFFRGVLTQKYRAFLLLCDGEEVIEKYDGKIKKKKKGREK